MPTQEEKDRINMDADTQIDSTILKLAEQYASLERRAKELNEEKAQIRKNADAIGISSLAWQIGVRIVKLMDKDDRAEFENGLKRVTSALGERQRELWPEDAERMRKRAERAAEKAAKLTGKEGAPDPDTNPRSDPAKGGAGKAKAKQQPAATTLKEATAQSDAAVKESLAAVQSEKPALRVVGSEPGEMKQPDVPPNPPGEQEEGAAALATGLPETTAKKSQSQIAAEIAEKAGTNRPLH